MKRLIAVAALCTASGAWANGTWQSVLQARDLDGNGSTDAYYDTDLNITWLQDARLSGAIFRNQVQPWLDSLTLGGAGGWRLPTDGKDWCFSSSPDCVAPLGEQPSELGHLWVTELGGVPCVHVPYPQPQPPGACQMGPITPFSLAGYFWSAQGGPIAVKWNNGTVIWAEGGPQQFYAWAVHDGDVAAVPEPATWGLMLAGIGVMGWAHRRRLSARTRPACRY